MRRGIFMLVMFLGSGRIALGCSSDAGSALPPSADAGQQDVLTADVVSDRPDPVDAAAPDPAPPAGLPDGWELERTYDKYCGFYVPKTKDKLPPPIRWEPCPATAAPAGADCRLMANDEVPGDKSSPAGAEVGLVKLDGSVVLGAYRSVQPGWIYQFIADADGPVHTAYLLTDPKSCLLATPSLEEARYTLRIFEHSSSSGGGFVAGDWALGSLGPRIAVHLSASSSHTPYASPFAILDLTSGFTFDQYSWANGSRLPSLWSAAQDSGLQQGIPVFANGAAFWPSSTLRYHKVKVYTSSTGVRDLLSAGMVTTRGYGDLGTDGKDMVWIDAQGRTTDTGPFDTYTITTAPFAADPTQVVPRRLRTEKAPTSTSRISTWAGATRRARMASIFASSVSSMVSPGFSPTTSPRRGGGTIPSPSPRPSSSRWSTLSASPASPACASTPSAPASRPIEDRRLGRHSSAL